MIFAAMSTVIAVFENIMSFWLETTSLSRRKVAGINILMMLILVLPAALSCNIWGNVTFLGMGFMDLEDKAVSNVLLPVGSLLYVIFCTSRYGWGFRNYFAEVNEGSGAKLPRWIRPYMTYVLPLIIVVVLIMSLL